jgi:hypothetical protein
MLRCVGLALLVAASTAYRVPRVQPTPTPSFQTTAAAPALTAAPLLLVQTDSRATPSQSDPTGAKPDVCSPITLDGHQSYRKRLPRLEDFVVAMGYLFSLTVVIILVPQFLSIISARSTFGVSVSSNVISLISSVASFVNAYVLNYYTWGSLSWPRFL